MYVIILYISIYLLQAGRNTMKRLFLIIITVFVMLLLVSCSNLGEFIGGIIGGGDIGNGGTQDDGTQDDGSQDDGTQDDGTQDDGTQDDGTQDDSTQDDDDDESDGTNQGGNDSDEPLIWNSQTDVYFISELQGAKRQSVFDKFAQLTGNVLLPGSDAEAKAEHELVIGPTSRPISAEAYQLLERNMTDDEDAEGYVILVKDGSVAVAYTSEAAYTEAINAFFSNCGVSEYYAENGLVCGDFYSLSARAEENRDKMYDEAFAKLEATLVADGCENASEIVKELRNYYSLFSTDMLYWLSGLYDPELGAFYYSNSGRDNFGYLPDLESTGMAFTLLDRTGLFSVIGSIEKGVGTLPEFITEPLINWARSLQSPDDGYFYHPQWGASIAGARLGRDLDSAAGIFKITKSQPYYNDPSGRMKGIYGAYGQNAVKPAVFLTSKLSKSTAAAVSAITPVALPGGPQKYLNSLDEWKNYVDNLDINASGASYNVGNTLASLGAVIKTKDDVYVDYLINYLSDHMYADVGLWEYQNEDDYDNDDMVGYNGVNGLMKLCVLYSGLGRAVPNAYNALQSVVKVGLYPNTDPRDESMCYAYNIWVCLNGMINNVKKYDPQNYPAAKQLLIDNMAGLLKSSYSLNSTHLREDGGFSYYERYPMNISQAAPVACSRVPESDVNSLALGTSSITEGMFKVLGAVFSGVEAIPIWCPDDYYVFMGELEKADSIRKKEIPPAELIDFNEYVETDIVDGTEKQPDDNVFISINTNYFSSNVVKRPGSADDADLALRMKSLVETEYDSKAGMHMPLKDSNGNYIMASGPANASVTVGSAYGSGNCYTFEADILFEEADIGQVLQLFFLNSKANSNSHMTGLQFNTFKSGNDTYIRIVDVCAGLDGSYDYNIYEKIKVGEWFTIKLEVYKVFIDNEDGTETLELYTKIFINDSYAGTTDASYIVNGKVNNIDVDQVMLSQYRYRGSTLYFDNIFTERVDKEYEEEVIRNEVTFDNGTICSSPAISVNVGSATGTLANDAVEDGDTEGGNVRNYYKIRTDVPGKVGDAVLEVYHKAGQKNSGYGISDIGIGITDGSVSGQVYVLEFDMMVNKIGSYNSSANYFTRIRIGDASNGGLWQDLTASGNDIYCRINSAVNSQVKLGEFGEWFHVKMIWNVLNPSNINLTDPNAHTYEYYLLTCDSEGNETLAAYRSAYSSAVASNKALNSIFFCGSENASDFDQQYFLDNITYIRTEDASILPEIPTEE